MPFLDYDEDGPHAAVQSNLTSPEGVFCRIVSETRGAAGLSQGFRTVLKDKSCILWVVRVNSQKDRWMVTSVLLDGPIFKKTRHS